MSITPVDVAIAHVRADSDEASAIQLYLDAAEDSCWQYLNRRVYATAGDLQGAQAALPNVVSAARSAYEQAMKVAEGEASREQAKEAREQARADLAAALNAADEVKHGMVINATLSAAALLMAGHLYRNREAVLADNRAAAVELPVGYRVLLWPYRRGLGV